MRQLDSQELISKFQSYASDLKYCDFQFLTIKLDQLINFLIEQDMSKRILERIDEDFQDLKSKMDFDINMSNNRNVEAVISSLKTRELQGAFACFAFKEKFEIEKKYSQHYYELVRVWYGPHRSNNSEEGFKAHFIEPFIELIEWYIYESKTIDLMDYFSLEKQSNISVQLEGIQSTLEKFGFGQKI